MKIIDLLNKIAKGEEVPKKIKYIGNTFFWNESLCDYEANDFVKEISSSYLFRGLFVQNDSYMNEYNLNDEVEVIEEEKEISKMIINDEFLFSNSHSGNMRREDRRLLDSNFKEISNKINELIDVINDMRDKE